MPDEIKLTYAPPWLCRVASIACMVGAAIGLLLAVPGILRPAAFSVTGTIIALIATGVFACCAREWWRRAK